MALDRRVKPGDDNEKKLRSHVANVSRLFSALALAAALTLAACGKKPEMVSPPQGEENDIFPRTYPSE